MNLMEPSSLTEAQPCLRACPLLKSSLLKGEDPAPFDDPDTGDISFELEEVVVCIGEVDELEYGIENED